MNADISVPSPASERQSLAELFRVAKAARARADANTLSDTEPYDPNLGTEAEKASAAVLQAVPETLADLLILSASVRLAVEDLDQWMEGDPAAMAMHDNLKESIGNIAHFLTQYPTAKPPEDLSDGLERIATGALFDDCEGELNEFDNRLAAYGGGCLAAELAE